MTPNLAQLNEYILNNQSFQIDPQTKQIKTENFFSSFWHRRDSSFQKTQFQTIAAIYCDAIRKMPPMTPSDVWKLDTIRAARKYLEKNSCIYKSDRLFQEFSNTLLAKRLSIPIEALDQKNNPGFLEFAKKNYLYNYLMTFNHTLKVDAKTHEVFIKYKGNEIRWKQANKIYKKLLASNFNIELKTLKSNPGFEDFALKGKIYDYLKSYPGALQLGENNKIKIRLTDRSLLDWDHVEMEKRILKDIQNVLLQPHSPAFYGEDGLCFYDRYQWKNLQPLLTGDTSKWAAHYIHDPLVFDENGEAFIKEDASSAIEPYPRVLAGDHTWVRLYHFKKRNDRIEGILYSVGLYRPGKQKFFRDNFWLPLRIRKGYLMNDISEVWGINDEIRTLAHRKTKAGFEATLRKINQDKAEEDRLTFHLVKNNCDRYSGDCDGADGIEIPNKMHVLELLTIGGYKEKLIERIQKLPQPLRGIGNLIILATKVAVAAMTPFVNLIMLGLGAATVDSSLAKTGVQAHINSFWDLFDASKTMLKSPWLLGWKVAYEVKAWRLERIARLDRSAADYEWQKGVIMFDLPQAYKRKALS